MSTIDNIFRANFIEQILFSYSDLLIISLAPAICCVSIGITPFAVVVRIFVNVLLVPLRCVRITIELYGMSES